MSNPKPTKLTAINYIVLSEMSFEQLIDCASEIETKIAIYSERDWLMTEAYIQKFKLVNSVLLDRMVLDQMNQAGEQKVG